MLIKLFNHQKHRLSAMKPRPKTAIHENTVPIPHPCSLDQNTIKVEDRQKFYESILNCVQRHICITEGYCKSTKKEGCRFDFPFEECEASHIEFTETESTVKAHIYLKRNDSFVNVHNKLILSHWCANVDMQIILDQAAIAEIKAINSTKRDLTSKNEYFGNLENV